MAQQPGAELLIAGPAAERGKAMLAALAGALPADSITSKTYTGTKHLLVLYGVGAPEKMKARERHLAAGGRVAMWDLGYWDREQTLRVAIDSLHPSAAQLERSPMGLHGAARILREDRDPAGPVMVVGIGAKSAAMLGVPAGSWERAAGAALRSRFPGRQIFERSKHGSEEPIEQALRGCSLVVCRHSNVAVDACIAGVPVECEDGAARALYADNPAPTRKQRAEFLRRLSWWQWRPAEAVAAWEWMRDRS